MWCLESELHIESLNGQELLSVSVITAEELPLQPVCVGRCVCVCVCVRESVCVRASKRGRCECVFE